MIDLHGGPRSSWLTLATGAPQRIGYDIQGRSWMYTHTVHAAAALRPRHSVVNQWDLLEAIEGWPGGGPEPGTRRRGDGASTRRPTRESPPGCAAAGIAPTTS